MPYGRAKNPEVVERVQRGQILSQPSACPHQVYEASIFYRIKNSVQNPDLSNAVPESRSCSYGTELECWHPRGGFASGSIRN
jgi:hypothetical protein